MQHKTQRLTESAMLLAVAIVLELASKMFIPEMPFGGQVTLASMLPVVLISYRHGVKWGLVAGVAYAFIQMAIGARTVAAAFQPGYFGDGRMLLNAFIQMAIGARTVAAAFQPGYFGEGRMLLNAFIMCVLDYLLAFTLLGLGGCFRNTIKRPGIGLACGSLVALAARYLAHVLSGYILFAGWAEWFFTQDGFPSWGIALVEKLSPGVLGFTYSLVYNAMYMVPEMIITAMAAMLLGRVHQIVTKVS